MPEGVEGRTDQAFGMRNPPYKNAPYNLGLWKRFRKQIHHCVVIVGVVQQAGHVLGWALRISSGVGEGIYKPVVQGDWEFLRIGVDCGQ